MILTRRRIMEAGGGALAAFVVGPVTAADGGVVDITMRGKADGSHVWFDPVGIHHQARADDALDQPRSAAIRTQ